MSQDSPSAQAHLVDITDHHRKVVFAFLKMLQSVKVHDKDSLESCISYLSTEFDVDSGGIGGRHDAEVDLVNLVQTSAVDKGTDEKFNEFLKIVEKKGYFKGVEEGTEEWNNRVAKAKVKFNQRNNPYDGLTAEELKSKGNELMGQAKYREAIAFYTKAIEVEPNNHLYYANRAAAYLHLKDNRYAITDCEKSIALNDKYAKAHARLGTAYFYDANYARAVICLKRALELDPYSETYREDLNRAEEKLNAKAVTPSPAASGGMPFMPPGMDFDKMQEMMKNPTFMKMAQNMMSNPQMMQMAQNFAKGMMTNQNVDLSSMEGLAPHADGSGNVVTPWGSINQQALEQFQRSKFEGNPKMEGIMQDVRANGMGAFFKYADDPEVMQLLGEFQTMMGPNAETGKHAEKS